MLDDDKQNKLPRKNNSHDELSLTITTPLDTPGLLTHPVSTHTDPKEDEENAASSSSPSSSSPSSSSSSSKPARVSSTSGGAPLRRKRPLQDKICRICGDKALAHNFDVISCESCKAFFRRNALKWEELQECAFQRSCPINIRTRRYCSACRLKKCFAIGMRADMILDEKKRRARQAKPSLKRSKQQQETTTVAAAAATTASANSAALPVSPGSSNSGSDGRPCSEEDLSGYQSQSHVQQQSYPSHHFNDINHQYSQEIPPPPSMTYLLSSPPPPPIPSTQPPSYFAPKALKGFEPLLANELPSDPHMYWRLTEEERALLTHISSTYQNTILRLPQQGGASEVTDSAVNNITLEDLLRRCDVCAQNVVKLMKGLSDYRTLQVEDQLAALKACAMRTLILKGAACFVVERDAWIKAYGELPVSLFVRLTGRERLILQHADLCRSLKTLLKNDVTMYALLQCVVLFDPRQPNIADRQLVNALHDKYMLLLKHYLESQVSYLHAEGYMEHLKDKLSELTVLAHHMTDMFRGWTGLIQPLMIEVLSLA